MTDFRRACGLRAYSGGTVPDSDRIHYSPLSLYDFSGTQTLFMIFLFSHGRMIIMVK